jgi:hypothetical protein
MFENLKQLNVVVVVVVSEPPFESFKFRGSNGVNACSSHQPEPHYKKRNL